MESGISLFLILMLKAIVMSTKFLPLLIAVVLGLSLLASSTMSCTQRETQPVIEFEDTIVNLGIINLKEVQQFDFPFKNVGGSDLFLHLVTPECDCTQVEYSKEAIKPGEKGNIHVTFDGSGYIPCTLEIHIYVSSNAKNEMVDLMFNTTLRFNP